MHDEALYAKNAFEAGARGYITKREAAEKIIAAIRMILIGKTI
jgi:DNA-binding NarL/FixJ family response regulator